MAEKKSKVSAGLLMYRLRDGNLEVFLVHPGGPFYSGKDEGVWSIPKGLVEPGENICEAALREFEEETGISPGERNLLSLGSVEYSSGKVVHAWAFEGDWQEAQGVRSNLFEMEWPPGSGRRANFPEIDRAAFFPVELALRKIVSAQRPFIDRLREVLTGVGRLRTPLH
ncbi:MAG: NUDIX domain-containing protein [Kiritimatiellae bacterium]|nr:NUDIX domain-containing protein [Kiritimatiellia bacterium]